MEHVMTQTQTQTQTQTTQTQSTRPDVAVHIGGFSPTRVLVVDDEARPAGIEPTNGEYGMYTSVWMIVRRLGRPVTLIKAPLRGGALSVDELDELLDVGLADVPPTEPVVMTSTTPRVTVAIPSMLAREVGLRNCVLSVLAVDYPDVEVIVVDNRRVGDQPVPDWLAAIPGVRVISEARPGISAARNRALSEATGEIIAFTDDDVTVDAGWLRAIVARFATYPQEAALSGIAVPAELETPAQVMIETYYGGFGPRVFRPVTHRLRQPRNSVSAWRAPQVVQVDNDGQELMAFSVYAAGTFGTGNNMAFRTELLRSAGGFDTNLGIGTPTHGGEDLGMLARLVWQGNAVGFEPAAMVHHTHRRDDAALCRQIQGYGTGFTALLLALIVDDLRHLPAMFATALRLATGLVRRRLGIGRGVVPANGQPDALGSPASDAGTAAMVADLRRLERRGMTHGPLAYLKARRQSRHWRP
jgi:hypothetical protein